MTDAIDVDARGFTHVDDVLNEPDKYPQFPPVLIAFLDHARSLLPPGPRPECWATHDGRAVRLCMASRMGDVGINTTGAPFGYSKRVALDDLTDFRATKEMGDGAKG